MGEKAYKSVSELIENKIQNMKIDYLEECGNKKKVNWFLYFSTITACLQLISAGALAVWTSPILPKLSSNDSEINPLGIPITTTQTSILASIPYVISMLMFVVVAKLSDIFGRKRSMTYLTLCTSISLVVLAFASNIYIYYACLVIIGVTEAGCCNNIPVYLNEIAEDCNRGMIACCSCLSVVFGEFCAFVIGPFTSVKVFFLIMAAPAILNLTLSIFLVESPLFLYSKGKRVEALECLERLRKNRPYKEIEAEFDKMEVTNRCVVKTGRFFDLFTSRKSRKAFIIVTVLCVSQQTSGVVVMISFTGLIFNYIGCTLSGDTLGVLIGAIQLVFYFVAAYFLDKLGRRPLYLFSCLSCAICTFFLGCFFYLKDQIGEVVPWFPLVFVVIFFICYSLGLGPIPVATSSEFFENKLRAVGVATVLIINCFVVATLKYTFPFLEEAIGKGSCMFSYSVCGLLAFIFMYLVLPETKGKSFKDIQEIL